ncbi:Nif11-like leader peptide family RiPP precursor [Selenomonas sp.]|uniref:Nif11-like leader peptide family RiPP precursor n=1 Tax=Selenomonas sp. TaxID=2053611 RepID=UPI003FA2DDA1
MSKMSDFYTKVVSDAGLRAKVDAVLAGKDIANLTDEELQKIGEIAKEAGFDISLDEAKEYLAAEAKELSDEALDAVAGGVNKGVIECEGKNAGTHDEIEGHANIGGKGGGLGSLGKK